MAAEEELLYAQAWAQFSLPKRVGTSRRKGGRGSSNVHAGIIRPLTSIIWERKIKSIPRPSVRPIPLLSLPSLVDDPLSMEDPGSRARRRRRRKGEKCVSGHIFLPLRRLLHPEEAPNAETHGEGGEGTMIKCGWGRGSHPSRVGGFYCPVVEGRGAKGRRRKGG